ncbi:MAG TPA: phosphotransferase [Solirubrobacteraceae bacterium]|jgi:aminoglycoside phosphotransferase (APT) family kinase protein
MTSPPALRSALLDLHRELLEWQRRRFERVHGRMDAAELLQAAADDINFSWLRPVSQLIADLDASDGAAEAIERARALFAPPDEATGFGRRYLEALQDEPAVVLAHARVLAALPEALAPVLRRAIERGDFGPLLDRLAPHAVLRTSSERGRTRVDGAGAIVTHLNGPGPGSVAHWDAREWPEGLAVTFEWRGRDGADRRRWYVRRAPDGRVDELWSAAARPTGGAPGDGGAPPPDALLRELAAETVEPLVHGGNSGAALLRATGTGGATYVLKRVTPGGDWLARATEDDGRTARLHAAGAFDRMPAAIESGIVAVAPAGGPGGASWIAMRDLHASLLGDEARLSRAQSRTVLDAAAQLHAAFRGAVPDGAATLRARLAMSTPAVAEAERAGADLLPKQFEHGWEAFGDVVDADVADAVLAHVAAPDRLAAALLDAYGGATLIHGDLRDDNLGFDGDRVVLIDWDMATAGTPTVDFAWYLAQDAWRIDATHDELEADHRAAQGDAASGLEIELGMISGLVQYGWLLAHSARVHPDPAETAWGRQELAWWVPRVRQALTA